MPAMTRFLIPILLSLLGGCISKTYTVADEGLAMEPLLLIDKRSEDSLKEESLCETHQIGDAEIQPPRLLVLQSALTDALPALDPTTVLVDRFDIVVIKPNMCRSLRGAITASVSYPAAAAMAGAHSGSDGVACQLSGGASGRRFDSSAFVPAGAAVRALYGFAVDGGPMGVKIKEVLEVCIDDVVRQLSEET